MIKRAKSGKIEEMVDRDRPVVERADGPDLTWSNQVLIKDVLEVPTISPGNIDIDLDEQNGDEIAVRV